MTAKVVSIINLKGGVGKSTLTMILSEYLAIANHKRVLVIDFDPQANLTWSMVRELHATDLANSGRATYHLFRDHLDGKREDITAYVCPQAEWVSNIDRVPGTVLDMVISTPDLARLDEQLLDSWQQPEAIVDALKATAVRNPGELEGLLPGIGQLVARVPQRQNGRGVTAMLRILRDSLYPVLERYDLILLDCPPGLSLMTSAAIVASDFFVSPVIPEPLSLLGIQLIRNRIAELRQREPSLGIRFAGAVLNKVYQWRNAHQIEASRMYGLRAGTFDPYPTQRYSPFCWWIPDAEHLRKVGDFACHHPHDKYFNPAHPGFFGWVKGKYGATNVRLNSSKHSAYNRNPDEGPQYYLSDRLDRLAHEFAARVGVP